MVDNTLTLSRSGLRDWVIQRLTAIIIGSYFIFLMYYLACHSDLTYAQWQTLFAHPLMRLYTLFTLLSVLFHTWVGLWIVFTDYIKSTWLRLLLQLAVIILLLAYVVWGIAIVW